MPSGKSWRTSHSRPQARAAGPTRPRATAVSSVIVPVPSNRAWTDEEFQSRSGRAGNVAERRFEATQALLDAGLVQIEADAAGPDHAAAEAAAAQEGGQVEEIAAEPPAVGGGRQEADVAGQGPQVAGVVGQPFQFQGDAAKRLRRIGRGTRLALPRPGSSRGVADRGVAGHMFHDMKSTFVRPADERALDAAMLVAERDLQVEDLLAVALEAEMPRLDDAGVNGADGDLVDLFALDAEEIGDAD